MWGTLSGNVRNLVGKSQNVGIFLWQHDQTLLRCRLHQRKYLRFLFRPNRNLDEELISYEIYVHVFTAVTKYEIMSSRSKLSTF